MSEFKRITMREMIEEGVRDLWLTRDDPKDRATLRHLIQWLREDEGKPPFQMLKQNRHA